MIKSLLKNSLRSVLKNRASSFLNVICLCCGLACFAFIATWVNDELSYDKFNAHHARIARVVSSVESSSGVVERAVTSASLGRELRESFPEIENVVRLKIRSDITRFERQQFHQSNILLADPSFFEIFNYDLKRGDIKTALNEPYSIILTESSAKKYFGTRDPMGESLTINLYDPAGYGAQYKVTGLIADAPANSHLTFSMIASFKTAEVASPNILEKQGWEDPSFYTYLLLKPNTDQHALSNKMNRYLGKYVSELLQTEGVRYKFSLQGITDIHLRSHLQNELQANGDIEQLYIFLAIGVIVLFLAGVNYLNLAIAGASKRAKEVGVKKVIGATKTQLISQYLCESIVTAIISLFLALLVCVAVQPLFENLTGKAVSPFSSWELLIFLCGVAVVVGTLAGLYPAFVLSSVKPVKILKGNYHSPNRKISLREVLVVCQFTLTIILVCGIIVVTSQMQFIRNKALGYEHDALVFLRIHGNTDVINGYAPFRNDLLLSRLFSSVTTSSSVPVGGLDMATIDAVNVHGKNVRLAIATLKADEQYLKTYGISVLAGRNFESGVRLKDSIPGVVVNEMTSKLLGYASPSAIVGSPLTIDGTKCEIVGVINNFHFESMHEHIRPLVISALGGRFSRITVKIDMTSGAQSIERLKELWQLHFPDALLDFDFVDTQLSHQYEADEKFSKAISYFSVLTLLIACLGLYGLVAFSARQRVKEIGIRKLLGASAKGISLMLSMKYFKLITVSTIVALPVAWYTMQNWLDNFAYKTSLSWWMFGISILAVYVLSMATISIQAIKAGIANPVVSLKAE